MGHHPHAPMTLRIMTSLVGQRSRPLAGDERQASAGEKEGKDDEQQLQQLFRSKEAAFTYLSVPSALPYR
ncbi:hypothetical protein OPV22_007012 [Ensete ventricosum]|uniref:Uncharacterized protein n=1 Tax=Ensete ventricosum TaxID=4639 RepID=A0AAV8Q7B5_ENSVE|nr:hypothetical protein OPV22_007012 [Ensete ventricosum]